MWRYIASMMAFLKAGVKTLVSDTDPLPVVVTNPPADPETGLAKEAKQLPDGHNVTILNPTTDPETGLAKETTQLDVLTALGALATELSQKLEALQAVRLANVAGTTINPSTEDQQLNSIAQGAMILAKLADIFGAVDGLELTADNIAINADSIALNVDEVESLLQQIRDRLPGVIGQGTNATSLGVVLSTTQQAILEAIRDRLEGTVTVSPLRPATAFTTGGTPLTAVGPSTTVGLLDGSAVSLMDFQFTFAPGGNMTVAVQGTNNPAAAIGDAVSANGWASLELHGLNGGRTSTVRNSGRQLLQNPPRFVRAYCTQYVSGSCGINGIAKPVAEPETQRYITDQDGLARWALTTFGQGQVAQRLYLLGGNFDDEDEFSDRWDNKSANGGTLAHTGGLIELHTGIAANGIGVIESQKLADFLGAVDNATTMRIKLGSIPADATFGFRYGQFDADNGWFVEVDGTGYKYKFRKDGVDSDSPFGILGVATITPNTSINLWEAVYNPNFVIIRNSNNFVQILIGNATLTPMFSEYDLPLRAEAFNSGSTSDHVLYIQTLTTERLGQQASSAVDTSPLGVNSFDMEEGSPAPTNAAPWNGVREAMEDYVQQTIVLDRTPMSAFGVVYFTYAKTKNGAASVETVPIDLVAGLPFVPYALANVGNWFKVDFVPDVASPAITNARMFVQKFKSIAPDITRNLGQLVYEAEPVKSQQAVIMGAPPDYNDAPKSTPFQRIRVSDRHTLGSLTTPLAAGQSAAGKWFRGLGEYAMGGTDVESDVTCQWRVEFSNLAVPVEFDDEVTPDESVQDFTDFEDYDPSQGIDKAAFAFLTQWARLKVVCGIAGMARFSGDISYFVTPLASGLKQARRPIKRRSLVSMGDVITESRTEESPDGAEVYFQDKASLNTVTGKRGKNAHITGIDVDFKLGALKNYENGHLNVGPARVQIPVPTISNVKALKITNLDADTDVFWGGMACAADSLSDAVLARGGVDLEIDGTEPVFLIAGDSGAVTAQSNRYPGATLNNSGVVNPNNLLTDDATRATFDNQSDSVQANAFTAAGSQPAISSVFLKLKARKGTNQTTEQASFVESKIGNALAVGSVATSAAVSAATARTLLAFVSREVSSATNGEVSAVTGGGLTWTQVATQNSDDDHRRLDCWKAYGNPTSTVVTASFATTPTSSRIAVLVVSGGSPTTVVQASGGTAANSASVVGPAIAGTNRGLSILAASINNTTSTAGAGYTERTDDGGTTGTTNNLTTETKELTVTGSETATCTLAGAKHYAALGVTILPAPATNPVITLGYKVGSDPDGSSLVATLDNTADTIYTLDVTGDRPWVPADLAAVLTTLTASTLGAANAEVNVPWLDVTEIEADVTAHCTYSWIGEP